MSEAKKDKKFTDGLFVKKVRDEAPEFIKGALSIKVDSFCAYLVANCNDQGWVNIDILESKDGKSLYAELNEWKPREKDSQASVPNEEKAPW